MGKLEDLEGSMPIWFDTGETKTRMRDIQKEKKNKTTASPGTEK
jgi:hypothetical protein